MERMDMHSRNEYLKVLREKYLQAKTRKEKSLILDEYCGNTGQARKYIIRKIQPGLPATGRRKRKYGVPKTPYQNLMESNQVSEEVKEELKDVYLGLNLS